MDAGDHHRPAQRHPASHLRRAAAHRLRRPLGTAPGRRRLRTAAADGILLKLVQADTELRRTGTASAPTGSSTVHRTSMPAPAPDMVEPARAGQNAPEPWSRDFGAVFARGRRHPLREAA
ncbi:hypothetical protein Kpho01_62180 [Kitasatospora phosalacinea]|uniref:Uncharacterized protein n=1 Tax=Kitasatospora phosalacinea TaxID=2065 RepID=A0A9W6PNZ7_9ACTN|nr:hypothetical protein Kpho01_62180 [Kitasatospora phosalacinea]